MEPTIEIPIEELSRQLKLSSEQITKATKLLDAGHSVPFLALFRLDETEGLGEGSLSRLAEKLQDYRQLERRKTGLVEYLRHRDGLNDEVSRQIEAAVDKEEVDQLYAIFKRSRPPKGVVERTEPVQSVVQRILDNSIDLTELDAEYERIVNTCDTFASIDEIKSCVREQIIQHFACSIPLRVATLRILRETGSFLCQRYHDPDQRDDDSPATTAEPHDAAADDEVNEAGTENSVSSDPATHGDPADKEAQASSSFSAAGVETTTGSAKSSDEELAAQPSADAGTAAVQESHPVQKGVVPVPSTKSSAAKKRTLSLAEDRRQRRKQARMRRRAHLEATLKEYFDKSIPLQKLSIHQFADIDYGERVRVLSTKLTYDEGRLDEAVATLVVPENSHHGVLLHAAWADARSRHILNDCERIIRREFTEKMEHHVIQAVKRHVRAVCMQRPLHVPILAISAHRDGFSVVAVDQAGRILATRDLSRNEYGPEKIQQTIKDLVAELRPAYVAVGASERTRLIQQMLVGSLGRELQESQVGWLTVPEDGVANYCRSAMGCEEIPGVSPEHRITIALARRAQDPLLEYVKVEPRDWLSEQQQTTVNVQRLRTEIQGVYQSCLARIGVDANSASPLVLEQLPGLHESAARKIEAHRIAHGSFPTIADLCQTIDLGPTVTELIGFLRIKNGEEPLDAIGVHPDHYKIAESLLQHCEVTKPQLKAEVSAGQNRNLTGTADDTENPVEVAEQPKGTDSGSEIESSPTSPADSSQSPDQQAPPLSRSDWDQRFRAVDFQRLSEILSITREHARRMVNELRFAGRDVRENSRLPVVRLGSLRSEDLQPGELLSGQVINTASFGAFVEIAPGTVGLIHVSRLGDGFVRDPREILMEGERIPVWVLSVDRERNRIALSLSPPGSSRSDRRGRPAPKRQTAARTSEVTSRSRQGSGARPRKAANYQPKPRRPKQVVPITEGMKAGNEPMRTFGDLKQFFDISKTPKNKPPQGNVPKNNKSNGDDDSAES